MKFEGKIENGKFAPDSPSAFKNWFMDAEKAGKRVTIEVKLYKKMWSISQNAFLWGVAYTLMAEKLSEINGEEVTPEEVHSIMPERFLTKKRMARNVETGEFEEVKIPVRTSKMKTHEFSSYIAFLQKWSSQYLDLYIPDPNELIQDQEGFASLHVNEDNN